MDRAKNIQRLALETFDLCIIGGGASGAGCALDAALRGLKVALIEKTDFAAETSSRSTKLVHGGVRYLEQAFKNLDFAQLRQVRHGLEERNIVLKNAPHLAHPIGLITPVFSWWEGLYFYLGLKIYDWFAGKNSRFPSSRWLSRKETLQRMPGLNTQIHSSVLYYDGQMEDARYCLALVQSAAQLEAVVANHLEVIDFQKDATGKIIAASVKDSLEEAPPFSIKATQFLNCTGPFADQIRHLANPGLPQRIRPSKGVHLVLSPEILQSSEAMLIPRTRDGRMVFAVPFEGYLLLGTTDEPYSAVNEEPVVESRERRFLLETLQPFVSKKIEPGHFSAGFGGIRPLILASSPSFQRSRQTKSVLRDHEVERDPNSGLISLLGGKWTTYRLMAHDALEEVCRNIPGIAQSAQGRVTPASTTQEHTLVGAEDHDPEQWKKLFETYGLEADICRHLASKYGSLAHKVANIAHDCPELRERIVPLFPFLKAEIIYTVRFEMARTIRDFLARRIRLEILDWEAAKQAAPVVARWMGQELGWSEAETQENIHAYLILLESFRQRAQIND